MRALGKKYTANTAASRAPVANVPIRPKAGGARIRMFSVTNGSRKPEGRPAYCALLDSQMKEWQREREKFANFDVQALKNAPKISGSSFAAPWSVQVVSQSELDTLKAETDGYAAQLSELKRGSLKRLPVALPGNPVLFGIGPLRAARGANVFDSAPSTLNASIITVRPGEWNYGSVIRGPYDFRAGKYLFVIDHYGLHLLHELTPCKTTARGFGGHTQLPRVDGLAAIGGEAFFSDEDHGTVTINFGSGRFPAESVAAMDATAKYWLACGLNRVVAVFSDRDLSAHPYGLSDRYGEQLQNKVYLRESPVEGNRDDADQRL